MTTPLVALAISSPGHIRAWHAVMDLARVTPQNSWTVVGGSMVYLHCAERDRTSPRETTDVDAMLNAREFPNILMDVTTALKSGGFTSAPGASKEGHHHRWELAGARVDLLIPRGIGPRLAAKKGADGGTTIQSPGGLQALERAESIDLLVGGREARISRPSLLGAIVGKAAAYGITQDPNRERHLHDLAILCGLIAARDNLLAITARDRFIPSARARRRRVRSENTARGAKSVAAPTDVLRSANPAHVGSVPEAPGPRPPRAALVRVGISRRTHAPRRYASASSTSHPTPRWHPTPPPPR